jgi:hypothetical protein
MDLKKRDPVRISARGSGVYIKKVSEPDFVCILKAEGAREEKDRVLKLCGDYSQIHHNQ